MQSRIGAVAPIVAVIIVLVLFVCVFCFILTLFGPAIGNVFSSIKNNYG